MFHNLHPWRSKKFSLRENRLAFDGETPDPTKRHEVAINEMEGEKEHTDVQKQVEDFRKGSKETQEKQKEAVKTAVGSIQKILNTKISGQMNLFMQQDIYKTADDSKKNELLQTRRASLCRDSAARFNSHAKLRGSVHADVGTDEEGDPMVVLTLVEQTPPAPDQQQKQGNEDMEKTKAKVTDVILSKRNELMNWKEISDLEVSSVKEALKKVLNIPANQNIIVSAWGDRGGLQISVKSASDQTRVYMKGYLQWGSNSIEDLQLNLVEKPEQKKADTKGEKKESSPQSNPAKPETPAKPEDPAKAKERSEAITKLTNESPAIGKLVTELGDARSQDVALAAIGKMSPDEMNVLTGALQKASKAIDPKKLILQSANYLAQLTNPVTKEAAKNIYKLSDTEISTLVKLFGNIEDAKKTVPGAPAEKVDTRPPPKTEGERLTREIEDAVAILKDPTKSNTEKFTAALSALGAVMDMIKNLGDLKGPPKKASATPPGTPGEIAKGPGAPSSGSESASKGPAGSPSGDEALRRKAKKEKGAANLEAYRATCNRTVQESDGQVMIQRRTLDGRKQQQKDLEKDLADAQKLTGPDGEKKKADIQHQIDLVKADITKIENTIKTIEASAKEARDDLKQMEDMEKRAKSVQQEVSNLHTSLTTFLSSLPAGAVTPDQQTYLSFFNFSTTSINQDFEIKMNLPGGGAEAFRKLCVAQNIGSQFAELGMHADGEVHDVAKFRDVMMQLAQKLFPGAGVRGSVSSGSADLPPIPGDRPSNPGDRPSTPDVIDNFKDVVLTPEKRTELMNKTITHIREFQRRGQKEIEAQVGNNGDRWPERRQKIERYSQEFEQSVDIIRKEGMNGTRQVQADLVIGVSNRLRQAQSETRIDCSDIRRQVDAIHRTFIEGKEPPAAAPTPAPNESKPAADMPKPIDAMRERSFRLGSAYLNRLGFIGDAGKDVGVGRDIKIDTKGGYGDKGLFHANLRFDGTRWEYHQAPPTDSPWRKIDAKFEMFDTEHGDPDVDAAREEMNEIFMNLFQGKGGSVEQDEERQLQAESVEKDVMERLGDEFATLRKDIQDMQKDPGPTKETLKTINDYIFYSAMTHEGLPAKLISNIKQMTDYQNPIKVKGADGKETTFKLYFDSAANNELKVKEVDASGRTKEEREADAKMEPILKEKFGELADLVGKQGPDAPAVEAFLARLNELHPTLSAAEPVLKQTASMRFKNASYSKLKFDGNRFFLNHDHEETMKQLPANLKQMVENIRSTINSGFDNDVEGAQEISNALNMVADTEGQGIARENAAKLRGTEFKNKQNEVFKLYVADGPFTASVQKVKNQKA